MDGIKSRYDLAILVVLYNCKLKDSKTVKGLFECINISKDRDISVLLWNNGPLDDINREDILLRLNANPKVSTAYVETLQNAPLSKIYNFFLRNNDSNAYVFFDNDSALNLHFLDQIFGCKELGADFLVPHVVMQGTTHGPVYNGNVISDDLDVELSQGDSFFAIGSGIVIYRDGLIKVLKRFSEVFDENFALYGVDTSFWLRVLTVARVEQIKVVCRATLNHSLSRLEKESKTVIEFRRRERGFDFGITLRRYPSLRGYWSFLKMILRRPFLRHPIPSIMPSLNWTIKGFVSGIHPRCKQVFSPSIGGDVKIAK